MKKNRIPLLSFFTGGGFLDIGFKNAGFDVKWTNENNLAFAGLYKHGMSSFLSSASGRVKSVSITETRSICDLTAPEIRKDAQLGLHDLFGVVGGPPCTDFSRGGLNSGHHGSRGRLLQVFVDLICDLKPSFFVIENVAGLRQTKKHRTHLDEILSQLETEGGFGVDWSLINALDLGIPQDRDRIFIVGVAHKRLKACLGHSISPSERGWFPWPHNAVYHGAKNRYNWPKVSKFGSEVKPPLDIPLELTTQYALTYPVDAESLPNGQDCFNPTSDKFETRDEGDVAFKSFKRLHRYRFSPTAWYGNNEVHLHPWKARRLSVREAMRLQTIPDEYILPLGAPLSVKFKMICNGVPCKMAEQVAKSLGRFLQPLHSETPKRALQFT